ncbi:MAG: LytTR family DNA-binding domain-containing protein [Ferruginibacter sp.]
MRTLIIEDELQAISALRSEIGFHCPTLEIIDVARTVKEGIEKIANLEPELIFLDIQLSDGLGFDILAAFKQYKFKVIFTTAYSQYAIKAIKLSALDYLLKPIDPTELVEAVNKAHNQVNNNSLQDQFSVLMNQLGHKGESSQQIVLKDTDKIYFIKMSDILFCKAEGAYTKFYLIDANPIFVSRNVGSFEELLAPAGFIRTHHSCLVNPTKIKVYDRKTDNGVLILEGGHVIPVSQRKKEMVLALLEGRT